MDRQEIKETAIWLLFEKGRNYHRMTNIYTDSDRNYRMYNGNQWEGANLGDIEPVQKNFIKPIVKYKVAVIHANLYAMNFSSMNYENRQFHPVAERICKMLNRFAATVWEKDRMDHKGRRVTKDAAINDEGILYTYWDEEEKRPVNEIIKKSDIYYGNENDDEIQAQPYILIRKRLPVANAEDLALKLGMDESKKEYIIADNDTFEESGEAAKQEVDDMVTVVYKLYRKKGTVHFAAATRWADIVEDQSLGITRYPVAHMVWEEKEGSARGEGEVRWLIPNQIEVNKTEMRRVLTVKSQAYPMKVVDKAKVSNPQDMNRVGAVIETKGATVDDVRKVVGTLPPAQMSPDVVQLQQELIQMSRDLAGAGEIATGQTNPSSASGRAILAVQQASEAPMTEQRESYKIFVEDVAQNWLEMIIANSGKGIPLQEEATDPNTGEKFIKVVTVPQHVLKQVQATVKIDITPKGVYDKFAQEQTLENFLTQGFFNAQRLGEMKAYVKALDDDAVAPKLKLMEVIEEMEAQQQRIAQINAQGKLLQQRAQGFLARDPKEQAAELSRIKQQIALQRQQGQAIA